MDSNNLNNRPSERFQFRHLPRLFVKTFNQWMGKDPFKLSAVVAYYAILSLPALLILILNLVGSIWGREIVQGQLYHEMSGAFGTEAAEFIQEIMTKKGIHPLPKSQPYLVSLPYSMELPGFSTNCRTPWIPYGRPPPNIPTESWQHCSVD